MIGLSLFLLEPILPPDLAMDTPDFDEIKVVKFRWLLRDFCCQLPSLKKASKYQAILGLIISTIFLLLGTGGNFLLARLAYTSSNDSYASYKRNGTLYIWSFQFGITFITVGALLLIYNLVLLSKVRANRGVGVFKTIKVGCLISLYIELFTTFGFLLLYFVIIIESKMDGRQMTNGDGYLTLALGILQSLLLLLTVLGIYGIHGVKPKIVSAFIYIKGIFYALAIILLLVMIVFNGVFLILPSLLLVMIFVYYYLKIFVLHVNMMTVDSNSPLPLSTPASQHSRR